MSKKLSFTFTTTANKQPVAFLDDMPNCGTELCPASLRSIAFALMRAADECEEIGASRNQNIPQRRSYDLNLSGRGEANLKASTAAAMRKILSSGQAEATPSMLA